MVSLRPAWDTWEAVSREIEGERKGGSLDTESWYLSLTLFPLFHGFLLAPESLLFAQNTMVSRKPRVLLGDFYVLLIIGRNFAETRQPASAKGIPQGLIKTKVKLSGTPSSINNADKFVTTWFPNSQSHGYRLHHYLDCIISCLKVITVWTWDSLLSLIAGLLVNSHSMKKQRKELESRWKVWCLQRL